MADDIPDLSDIGIPSATGAGALALYFLVGPTLKAVGNAFGEWTDYRMRNLLRIGEKTQAHIEQLSSMPTPPPMHPRLAKNLIDDASWIDDDLQQAYYASLLFSGLVSETTEETAYFARIVAALTPSQIRLHFAVYSSYRGTFDATSDLVFTRGGDLAALAVLAPIDAFRQAARSRDDPASPRGMGVATGGLAREGLIGRVGWADRHEKTYAVYPTLMGMSLFHLGMGYPAGIDIRRSAEWLKQEIPRFVIPDDPSLPSITGARIGRARQAEPDEDNDVFDSG